MNRTVKLIECPRDAWQGLGKFIPTELKVRYLRALIAAGFKHIDAVSFVSPKAVPQMADSEEVLAELDLPKIGKLSRLRGATARQAASPADATVTAAGEVEIIGIVVNEIGAERAIATGRVTTLGYPCSISETFLRRNQNQSIDENYRVLETIKKRADDARMGIVVYISMAFGNPYGDPWSEADLGSALRKISAHGIRAISLADTVGVAGPELIRRVVEAALGASGDWGAHAPSRAAFGALAERPSGIELGVHLHSTPADAVAKILAAYNSGCRRFDSAIGGLGGCPFAQNALVGNIPTESVIEALRKRGVTLPVAESIGNVLSLNMEIAAQFA